ncbi:MAG: SusD/RagB family nutrient-binding outer membrane lipoprotein [Bacteroidales bacterium]
MNYKSLVAASLLGAVALTGCQDQFADINSNPSDITKPNIRFLFTEALTEVEPMDYAAWYYDFARLGVWNQATVSRGGNIDRFNLITEQGSTGSHVYDLLRMANEIRFQISKLEGSEKEKYEYVQYLLNPLLVMIGMNDSDVFGYRQYTEAEMARYTNPPLYTPKYDTQEELFDVWLKELNETIDYLTTHKITNVLMKQDFIYNDDVTKWAKLANSMKLKVAARLINVDRTRAISIVNEVAASEAGVLEEGDDLIFNKGKYDNHWNNDVASSMDIGSDLLINFMKENKDTRLLSVFTKNDFNGAVVQAFLDQKKELPPYIAEKAIVETNDKGVAEFKGWKAPGEPWVRYYGAPLELNASDKEEYKWIFNPSGTLFTLKTSAGADKKYTPLTYRNQEIVRGVYDFTYPDAPDATPDKDVKITGWHGIYFSAAEVNLLMAEFKLLGANLPKSAQDYLTEGARLSALSYDKAAELNEIPYYSYTCKNDKHDATIKVTQQMLAEMLESEVLQLNGSMVENLEKVYIQQYIHYMTNPIDQYVTVRRSGIPMKGSELLPWQDFHPTLATTSDIPRRFRVTEPKPSDQLYDLTVKAYTEQGFTYGADNNVPSLLNSERIWYDKNAPQFGAGPQL